MNAQSKITILLVEDHLPSRYAVTRILKKAGFAVKEAATGQEALRLAQEKPDIIILDVHLPDISGFEVCRTLKADPNTASIPVLHLSSTYVLGNDKVLGLESGADCYLIAPVEPPELIATVNALLRIRRAEAEARALAGQWQASFDAVREGVAIVDVEGQVLRCNRALAAFLGKPLDAVVGRQSEQLIQLGPESSPGSSFQDIIGTLVGKEIDRRIGDHWFHITIDALRDSEGNLTGAVYVLSDITQRKDTEVEREQLLAGAQKARAEAEAANRMKDEFLATLSHELRTPLNAIMGWIYLARMGRLGEKSLRQALDTIERNAKSQTQIIEDLLDVSRIVSGQVRLDTRMIDVAPIIQAALDVVRPAATAKGIGLEVHLDAGTRPISGDPARLQQVIWNLLSNAVKFSSQGGRVEVHLKNVDASVQIQIRDTGQGIRPDFLPYVFDRFRQADSSSARVHGGLGLGLAIARHLVELHGGTVQVESPGEGLGATFHVRIPAAPLTELSPSTSRSALLPASPTTPPRPALNGVRVLVVEDNVDGRELLTLFLKQVGADVTAVGSAREALETLERMKPDVLVSDIGMPGQDGYHLIRQLRALAAERCGQIPAVALTGYARDEDRKQALLAGYQAHVSKPVDPDKLLSVIATLTGRNGPL